MATELTISSDLERRLVRLENRNRQWRMATGLLLTIVGVIVLSGSVWRDNPRMDVRELRLVDDQGRPRMLLTLTGDGHPKILMVDSDGLLRAQYSAELLAFEERGTPRLMLGNGNQLQLFDDAGKSRAELSVDRSGSFLMLRHGPGKAFARIGVSNTGEKFVTQSTAAANAAR